MNKHQKNKFKFENKNNICKTFFKLFTSPKEAFQEIDREKGIGGALLILLLSVVLGRIVLFISAIIPNLGEISSVLEAFDPAQFFLIGFLQIIFAFLIGIGIYIMLRLFRIKAGLAATFKIISFSAVPYIILGSILFFDMWIFFLSAFFVITGIKELFNTSALKSAITVITAYFIFWLVKLIYGLILIKVML